MQYERTRPKCLEKSMQTTASRAYCIEICRRPRDGRRTHLTRADNPRDGRRTHLARADNPLGRRRMAPEGSPASATKKFSIQYDASTPYCMKNPRQICKSHSYCIENGKIYAIRADAPETS